MRKRETPGLRKLKAAIWDTDHPPVFWQVKENMDTLSINTHTHLLVIGLPLPEKNTLYHKTVNSWVTLTYRHLLHQPSFASIPLGLQAGVLFSQCGEDFEGQHHVGLGPGFSPRVEQKKRKRKQARGVQYFFSRLPPWGLRKPLPL